MTSQAESESLLLILETLAQVESLKRFVLVDLNL